MRICTIAFEKRWKIGSGLINNTRLEYLIIFTVLFKTDNAHIQYFICIWFNRHFLNRIDTPKLQITLHHTQKLTK